MTTKIALQVKRIAHIAILASLAIILFACDYDSSIPVPKTTNTHTATATANLAFTQIPHTAVISPTAQYESPIQTPSSSAIIQSDSEEKIPPEMLRAFLTSTSSAPDQGFVSLDERILRSSIIARVTMTSVAAHAQARYTPVKYLPMIHFTFDVHEYLKGSGNDAIAANVQISCVSASCQFPNEQKAIDHANNWLSNQTNRWWENRESVIFLQKDELTNSKASAQSAATIYKFLPWNERRNSAHNYATTNQYPYSSKDGYSILSDRNRVWLPSTSPSSDASGSAESRFMLGNKPKDLYPGQDAEGSSSSPDISLSGLKSRIKAITDVLRSKENIEDYEKCLRAKFDLNRIPWTPYSVELPTKSGIPAGTVLDSGATGGLDHYGIYFFSGVHKDFFEIIIEDNDNDPYNNYYRTVKTLRPLVAREYSVVYHQMPGILMPCIGSPVEAYTDKPTANWTIRATAPDGTLYEAFFDPVAIDTAIGADSANGALNPIAFTTTNAAKAEIRRVDWTSKTTKIQIANPPTTLANHHIDFIALDGSITLRLDFDDATISDAATVRTISWPVCNQPWVAGDILMIRISESSSDLTGVTRQTSCPADSGQTPTPSPTATEITSPAPQQTATPTPTETATDTETPTATATPTPSSTLTPTPSLTPTPTATSETPPSDGVSGEIDTPTPTPSPTGTATASATPTHTPTPTITATPTATPSPTPTLTVTPTPEEEPPPGGVSGQADTPTVAPTATATPTATSEPAPPPSGGVSGAADTPTPTPTATPTQIPTATETLTQTPTATSTFTPTPTATATAISTPTITPTPTHTETPTPTATPTPTQTATPES